MPLTGHSANEPKVYGKAWDLEYCGYFADPIIAAPLVEAIVDAATRTKPSVIADLGGGTGFVLQEIHRQGKLNPEPSLICVDIAEKQLKECPEPISRLEHSVEEVSRDMLIDNGRPLMLCMRSVLHYFSREMLDPDLSHIRSILKEGEYFIHQTLCFQSKAEQATANLLSNLMQTGKWLPTVHSLVKALEMEGFEVTDIRPAAPLQSTSADMENRYGFSHEAMMKIGRAIEKDCLGHLSEVFHRTNDGFTAYMKYKILTCVAKP